MLIVLANVCAILCGVLLVMGTRATIRDMFDSGVLKRVGGLLWIRVGNVRIAYCQTKPRVKPLTQREIKRAFAESRIY